MFFFTRSDNFLLLLQMGFMMTVVYIEVS